MGKGKLGGRYDRVTEASGYYGRDTAGQRHFARKGESGTKREFKGSGEHAFVFYRPGGGTVTIYGKDYDDAWRQAKALGYRTRKGRRRR